MLVRSVSRCCRPIQGRTFMSSASVSSQTSLDEDFPATPQVSPQAPKALEIKASTTSSGLKLASHNGHPYAVTLGIDIATGTRDETEETAGLSQLFSRLAFRATETRSDLRLYRDIEAIGGRIYKEAGRDFIRYNISVLEDQVDAAAEILAETTLRPRLAKWDIETQKHQLGFAIEDFTVSPAEVLLDGLHAAAFYDDLTLGRTLYSSENIKSFEPAQLQEFYNQYVNTSSVSLVGAGIEHSALASIANEWFGDLPKALNEKKSVPARYVGGEWRYKKAGPSTYVALGFAVPGQKSGENGAAQVLKSLLDIRQTKKEVSAFLNSYDDVSLVGLSGYAAPLQAGALVDSFVEELKKVANFAPSNDELAAAKGVAAMNASDRVATLQGRLAWLSSLARSQATPVSPADVIKPVTAAAVQDLAKKVLATRPSLASIGKLSSVPHVDAVAAKLK